MNTVSSVGIPYRKQKGDVFGTVPGLALGDIQAQENSCNGSPVTKGISTKGIGLPFQ